jgi:hypothetical protein
MQYIYYIIKQLCIKLVIKTNLCVFVCVCVCVCVAGFVLSKHILSSTEITVGFVVLFFTTQREESPSRSGIMFIFWYHSHKKVRLLSRVVMIDLFCFNREAALSAR